MGRDVNAIYRRLHIKLIGNIKMESFYPKKLSLCACNRRPDIVGESICAALAKAKHVNNGITPVFKFRC